MQAETSSHFVGKSTFFAIVPVLKQSKISSQFSLEVKC